VAEKIIRIGSTVRRPVTPSTFLVAELLLYLERSGFGASPNFIGVDSKDREVLSWVDGNIVADEEAWRLSLSQLADVGSTLRHLHDLTRDWRPRRASISKKGSQQSDVVVVQGDVAPRNTVW